MTRIGFLGTGKMATAIARGLLEQNAWPRSQLTGTDISTAARLAFTESTGVVDWCEDSAALVREVDILILAVKPQDAQAAATVVSGQTDKLIISIVAGLTVSKLVQYFGHDRIARVMPNTPATIGRGASVYTCGPGVTRSDRETIEQIFGAVGLVWQQEERMMDAVTALSGSGPAYVFAIIQALADAGVAMGLDAGLSLELTVQTMAGAVAMVQEGIGSPDTLRQAVTSPGGTTEAGLRELQKGGLQNLLQLAVRAACKRSQELGKSKE